MKFLKISGIVLSILIVVLALLTFVLPTSFSVEERIEIQAEKEVVYPYLSSFKMTNTWSPWANLDPEMEQWIEGTDGEVGAKYFWKGNDQAGEGYQEFILIEANRIEVDLVFLAPFESTAHTYFEMEENNHLTDVIWGFQSEMPRPYNLMSLFFDLEEEISKDYNKGLKNLKSLVESKQN